MAIFWIFSLITLFGLFFVSTFLHAIRRNRKAVHKAFFAKPKYYFHLHKLIFGDTVDALLFTVTCAQHTLRVLFLLFIFAAYFQNEAISFSLSSGAWSTFIQAVQLVIFLVLLILVFIILADLAPRIWATHAKVQSIESAGLISSFFLFLFLPLTYPLFHFLRSILPEISFSPFKETEVSSKEKLIELIKDVDDGALLNEHDKKLIHSVLYFRDRIAREVMVPRVNLFCLPATTTIKEAARLLEEEGYSRVPVYKNSIDEVVGVIMYKDILLAFMLAQKPNSEIRLEDPIEKITKNVLYAPETKKISQLLQEFRKKQMHMAIVVDEYGGTAGVCTIEDILEEIVGEIADEYDKETAQYVLAGKNAWLVDARMNLIDLEEELGIKIPQEGDYDTIAGYVFYRLGCIPEKGTVIHHDEFELEIVASNDRSVEKVKITRSL